MPTLAANTLFISDLHLSEDAPERSEMLSDLLLHRRLDFDTLYILGDLFDFWIGDDGVDLLGHRSTIDLIRSISERGVEVYIMHGNRDFLIGEEFCTMTGATLLADPTVLELRGQPVLLCHGDHLCTDDVEHQQFRQQARQPEWQQSILQQDLQQRLQFAQSVRAQSDMAKSSKTESIMDVTASAVTEAYRRSGTRLMIHGHTHRPAIHRQHIDHDEVLRIVLGDWRDSPSFLTMTDSRMQLIAGSGRPDASVHWPF